MNSRLGRFIDGAEREVVIVGTNALIPDLERSARYLHDHLGAAPSATVTVMHESDNENFNQSVLMSAAYSSSREGERPPTFTELSVHLNRVRGTSSIAGLRREIEELAPDADTRESVVSRVQLHQLHLRTPMDIIQADHRIWCSPVTHRPRTIDDYGEVEEGTQLYSDLRAYVRFLTESDPEEVGVFLSDPSDELIWVYDRSGVARGIFPRAAFYTTEFARYSVWGLVFNRRGELLLQRRSLMTKDNRGMWDKSIGGHVDLEDASTSVTAKRELIEEMYLPRAEFTKHVRADLGDIIDFGEWNPRKRPERIFREAFRSLAPDDWVMFRALDSQNELPLTVNRISERRWTDSNEGEARIRRTVFISDVYFFMAPMGRGSVDDMIADLASSEEAAASAHRFISIKELADEIEAAERDGVHEDQYTDDLLYLMLEHRDLLDSVSAFARYVADVD